MKNTERPWQGRDISGKSDASLHHNIDELLFILNNSKQKCPIGKLLWPKVRILKWNAREKKRASAFVYFSQTVFTNGSEGRGRWDKGFDVSCVQERKQCTPHVDEWLWLAASHPHCLIFLSAGSAPFDEYLYAFSTLCCGEVWAKTRGTIWSFHRRKV